MAYKWKKTAHPGVRCREHSTRKHGVQKDKYFAIYYRLDGKRREEGLGWASQGWNAQKAAEKLAELKSNQRTGEGPQTLEAKRQIEKARLEVERVENERQRRAGITLDQFWHEDYFHTLKNRVKQCSWEKEESHYRLWLSPLFGAIPLREITDIDLEKLQDRIRAAKLSDRSHEYILGSFRRIWKHAYKRKIVSGECPVGALDIPRSENSRLRALKQEEFRLLLDTLRVMDLNAYDVTLFAALTGCRASEAFGLKWEHVDLDRKTALFPETKNKQAREVFLAPELLAMIKKRGPGLVGHHVFTKSDGSRYPEAPSAFATAVKNLGLNEGRPPRERITFHVLRHSAATFAGRRGVPPRDMQEIFGWKTPSMVLRYCKPSEDLQRRAMESLQSELLSEDEHKVISFPTRKKEGS